MDTKLPLALKVNDLDNVATLFSNEGKAGSCIEIKDKSALSFTPAMCAAMQCSLALRFLCGREIKNSSIKYFDLLNMEFETIEMI